MKPCTVALCFFFILIAIFGGLAGYVTYQDATKCDDYDTNVWALMTSINYTNTTEYGVLYCNECQNGGAFPPCTTAIEQNLNGSCHIHKNKKCKFKGEFTWTDENGIVHYESYDTHNEYNSLQHCVLGHFQVYHFTISVDYQVNGQNGTGHFETICNDPLTSEVCFVHVIQSYIVGDDVIINVNKNDDSIRLNLNCDFSDEFRLLWIFTGIWVFIFLFIAICSYEKKPKMVTLCYSTQTDSTDFQQYEMESI